MKIDVTFAYEGNLVHGELWKSSYESWNLIVNNVFWARICRDKFGWLIKPSIGRRLWNQANYFATVIEGSIKN